MKRIMLLLSISMVVLRASAQAYTMMQEVYIDPSYVLDIVYTEDFWVC